MEPPVVSGPSPCTHEVIVFVYDDLLQVFEALPPSIPHWHQNINHIQDEIMLRALIFLSRSSFKRFHQGKTYRSAMMKVTVADVDYFQHHGEPPEHLAEAQSVDSIGLKGLTSSIPKNFLCGLSTLQQVDLSPCGAVVESVQWCYQWKQQRVDSKLQPSSLHSKLQPSSPTPSICSSTFPQSTSATSVAKRRR